MKGVRLSLAAEGDLQAIDDYTIAHFGLRQAIKTAAALQAAMIGLARNPRSARLASDLEGIRVARVLHGDQVPAG